MLGGRHIRSMGSEREMIKKNSMVSTSCIRFPKHSMQAISPTTGHPDPTKSSHFATFPRIPTKMLLERLLSEPPLIPYPFLSPHSSHFPLSKLLFLTLFTSVPITIIDHPINDMHVAPFLKAMISSQKLAVPCQFFI